MTPHKKAEHDCQQVCPAMDSGPAHTISATAQTEALSAVVGVVRKGVHALFATLLGKGGTGVGVGLCGLPFAPRSAVSLSLMLLPQ